MAVAVFVGCVRYTFIFHFKKTRARELVRNAVEEKKGVLSTQVLQEFYVVATRKLGVSAELARRKADLQHGQVIAGVATSLDLKDSAAI